MNNEEAKEQRIFYRQLSSVEVCGRCGGRGRILQYSPTDIFKLREPKDITCPLCEGSGLLKKVVSITTDLSPFKQEKY